MHPGSVLAKLFSNYGAVSRIGGDEFCILCPTKQTKNQINTLMTKVNMGIKNKIKEVAESYNDVVITMKEIDGSNENWQGEDQKLFYETLEYITKKYEGNMSKLTELYNFLCKVINDYENRDENFGKDLERNAGNLDM